MFQSTKELADELLKFHERHMNGVRPAAVGVWVMLLVTRHPVSIPVLASKMQLSYETVKKYLAELMERGLVKQAPTQGYGAAAFRNATLAEMQDDTQDEGEAKKTIKDVREGKDDAG